MIASGIRDFASALASNVGNVSTLATFDGKWVFVGALALVMIWLIVMPRRLVGQPKGTVWWRSVRLWAIVICVVQMWIYWQFG